MDELISWLRGQLDEDERARAPRVNEWTPEPHDSACPGDLHTSGDQCECGRPAFVLADIAAKRAILAEHGPNAAHGRVVRCRVCCGAPPGEPQHRAALPYPCDTLRYLASAFAARPGYLEEWRPRG